MDIAAELKGKNPKRVAAGLRQKVLIQRRRRDGWVFAAAMNLALAVAPFYVPFIPRIVQIVCFILVPFSILGIVADSVLLRRDKERLRAVEEFIAKQS